MLKAAAAGIIDGKAANIVVLGLSHMNLTRLKEGDPIKFDASDLGLPGTTILIFSGETERSMARDLQEFIGPNTDVDIDPRLRD